MYQVFLRKMSGIWYGPVGTWKISIITIS